MLAIALAILARQRTDEAPVARAPLARVGKTLLVGLPALVLPVPISTAVVEGVATATEVSTIGIAYRLVVGVLVYRQLDEGAATGMAWALTQPGFSHALAQAMAAVPDGQWGFLAASVLAFIVLGSVLEGIPAMVLFGPLLFPIAREMGVNAAHCAVVIILAMGIGLFAPPFGLGCYTACTIGKVHPDVALREVWPHLGVPTPSLLLLAAVPWFSTGFLP